MDAAQQVQGSGGGLLAPLSDGLESVLKLLQTGLDTIHVPYSYGWSIILLTLLVKVATYPFLKKQVRHARRPARPRHPPTTTARQQHWRSNRWP